MTGKAPPHDFSFNQNVVKSFVFFLIFRIKNQITINVFRAGADIASAITDEIVFLAKILICFALANGLASHIPDTNKIRTVGKEVTNAGFC